jgi:hypoxanthine phosphoribosyltransferase
MPSPGAPGQPADDASKPSIRVLYSADAIAVRVRELGARLASSHAARRPLLLGTLTGAAVFTADLARAMNPTPPGTHLDFVRAASYDGRQSTGVVEIGGAGCGRLPTPANPLGTKIPVDGRHVILIEDIVDTGRTLVALKAALRAAGAVSVTTVALLDKPARRGPGGSEDGGGSDDADAAAAAQPDLAGFTVGDEFVVGYGLDWDEEYRCLPFIGVVE